VLWILTHVLAILDLCLLLLVSTWRDDRETYNIGIDPPSHLCPSLGLTRRRITTSLLDLLILRELTRRTSLLDLLILLLILVFSTWCDDRSAKKADAIRSLTSIAILQTSIIVYSFSWNAPLAWMLLHVSRVNPGRATQTRATVCVSKLCS